MATAKIASGEIEIYPENTTYSERLKYLDVRKDTNKSGVEEIVEISPTGRQYLMDRILCSAIASYLGETQYAIHSVCIGIAGATEEVTNCWCQNQIVKLQGKSEEEKFKIFKTERKKTFLPAIIISLTFAFILFIPMKGELPTETAFKYLLLYLSQILFLCPYENYRGLLTSLGFTQCMPLNVLIGTLFRLGYAYICIVTPIGLTGFAFMISISFTLRAFMYTIAIKRKYNILI